MIDKDESFMKRCFQLATNGMGCVAPNPMVGAVIVHDGRIIGEGWHRQWGGPHAEVNAVASVLDKSLLCNSTIYVSLEPCSHYGKTPPCAKLLVDCGFPRVVVANMDPFPLVSGRGVQMLRDSGAVVETGLLEAEGWELNRRFFTFHTKHRPYVILKWAQTANGFMASAGGGRLFISNPVSSVLVHKLRAEEAAILVGTNTAMLDNPKLTVRDYSGKNPVRVLIDRRLCVPDSFNIYNDEAKTIVFTEADSCNMHVGDNVHFVCAPFDSNGVDLNFVMETLYNTNLQSLIVEGGASLLNSFVRDGFVDECRVETNLSLSVADGLRAPQPVGRVVSTEMVSGNMIQKFRS